MASFERANGAKFSLAPISSKYFFSKLNGQVFILSTNEEIDSDHVKIMKDKICATYMLENVDNKQTIIVGNTYFED